MNPNDPAVLTIEISKPKTGFWSRLGGTSLTIAVAFHLVLAVIAGYLVFQVIYPPERVVDFTPGGTGGGGPRGAEAKVNTKSRQQLTPATSVKRVFAEGAVSNFALPEQGNDFGEMSALSSLSSGGPSGGLGGVGSGSHGFGPGRGDGGMAVGGNGLISPFGLVDPTVNALRGAFYDLKQTRDRESTEISNGQVAEVIRDFVNRGWNEKSLERYYKAGRTLYQNRIHIPLMRAESAPEAFECAGEVQPSRWVVVYRGMVTPPKSGKWRFVGAGDDVMVVRFNGRNVLDHGFTSGTTAIQISSNLPFFRGEAENPALKKLARRDFPVKTPVSFYQYPTTRNWNDQIGGLAVGREFEAVAGRSYPIEILISEIPGGLFCAALLIEEVGATYQKASTGSPILPLFRLDNNLPAVDPKADNAPPFEPAGPVWRSVGGTGFSGV